MIPLKNKGMFLEEVINITNSKYLENNICVVSKIPTSYKLIKTEDNLISKAKFIDNFNCDYIGCYKGNYFEFEAKETTKNSFSYNAIRKNQLKKLDVVIENNGIAFLIIYFSNYDKYFVVDWPLIKNEFENKKTIPFEWFEEFTFNLEINNNLILDYLNSFNLLTNYI